MKKVSDPLELGSVIREERKRQGLTQTELADVSGVGLTFVSQLENGEVTAEIGKVMGVVTMLGMDLFVQRRGED